MPLSPLRCHHLAQARSRAIDPTAPPQRIPLRATALRIDRATIPCASCSLRNVIQPDLVPALEPSPPCAGSHGMSVVGTECLEPQDQQASDTLAGARRLVLIFTRHKSQPLAIHIREKIGAEHDAPVSFKIEGIIGL